jgi:LysR family transcriptional regulator, transcriptional activator of nhaA
MLNYKQLFYFWKVAKAGSIARTAEQLHITPQTISGQLGELEKAIGVELFRRRGRRLELTPAGKLALVHAEEIFQIGTELEALLRYPAKHSDLPFRVGIADVIPKSIACRLLAPVMEQAEPIRLICQEDKLERLFAELAIHKLDLVLADRPLPTELGVKGYSHLLGGSPVVLMGTAALVARYGENFPASLTTAPFLIPGEGAALRGPLERWLNQHQILPRIVGEFDDAALMKAFGQIGGGIFPAPAVIADEVARQYQVEHLGLAEGVNIKYYAISVERKITHPSVLAVRDGAKQSLLR